MYYRVVIDQEGGLYWLSDSLGRYWDGDTWTESQYDRQLFSSFDDANTAYEKVSVDGRKHLFNVSGTLTVEATDGFSVEELKKYLNTISLSINYTDGVGPTKQPCKIDLKIDWNSLQRKSK